MRVVVVLLCLLLCLLLLFRYSSFGNLSRFERKRLFKVSGFRRGTFVLFFLEISLSNARW